MADQLCGTSDVDNEVKWYGLTVPPLPFGWLYPAGTP
jgi:hypothetical protein